MEIVCGKISQRGVTQFVPWKGHKEVPHILRMLRALHVNDNLQQLLI
jgi:hypothetical protein